MIFSFKNKLVLKTVSFLKELFLFSQVNHSESHETLYFYVYLKKLKNTFVTNFKINILFKMS